jgi:alpha-ribazole phosphatase/probable phosphoglycerate mutase
VFAFIRHGQTDWNRDDRLQGSSDIPLNDVGREQAHEAAAVLRDGGWDAIVSSPLSRARETAEIIAQPHALAVVSAPDFNELDLRRWEGMTAAEIEARDPDAWKVWCADPARLRLQGIESFADLRQRVRRGLDSIVRRHAGAGAAIVTHDGVIRIAVIEALGIGAEQYRSIPVDNTGLTILDVAAQRVYLRALNDTGHMGDPVGVAVAGPADR